MLSRRRFLFAGLCLALAHPGAGQQVSTQRRVGVLSLARARSPFWQVFEDELAKRGWTVGGNLAFAFRFAGGDAGRLPALAAELAGLPVDVLVADLGATAAAAQATSQIPIVMRFGLDAIEAGRVKNLARPANNITGLSGDVTGEVMGKRLELLREIAPKVRTVAVLTNMFPGIEAWQKELEEAARKLGLMVRLVPVQAPEALEAAFDSIRAGGEDALFCGGDAVTFALRPQITAFALRERLPAVYGPAEWAEDGGLVSYGVNLAGLYRQAADYVDKLLRGAKPADLPVQRALRYELAVNLRTARALGITVPPSLLVRADRVID